MDGVCNNNYNINRKSKLPVPKCRVNRVKPLTRLRKIPALNTFGPFPDETITIAMDRILYFLGGRKMQKFFHTESTSGSSGRSLCSMRSVCYKGSPKCPTYQTSVESFYSSSNVWESGDQNNYPKINICPIDRGKSTPRKILQESHRDDDSCLRKSMQSLKRSFSLCSLTCRKIKEKMLMGREPSSPPKWLWTKLQDYGDGWQVYEVFTNSSTSSHPTQFETEKAPRIIFVILPTGVIMPFETLIRH
ncbi:uncharacterized protein LOC131802076 [Musca domestica]|uniref:Uncharacterized protein LOC131802076 n=1 Tax=Musca domestica TaxID=7370 RepID=A0ABM3UV68_MUSDO|nr:uncharacterized protein LOC131802076 [Musca domestica]